MRSPPHSFVLLWNRAVCPGSAWVLRYFSLKRALMADPS